MPGQLVQVSVGNAQNVWGVNSQGQIWQWNGTQWTSIPGQATQVSIAADGTAWIVNQTNLWSYTGSGWNQLPGQLLTISVGSASNVWGVNVAAQPTTTVVWHWDGSQWTAIPSNGCLSEISVGADGTVYGLGCGGNIYLRKGSVWQQLSGNLSVISAGLADRFSYSNPAVTHQGSWSTQSNANAAAGGYLQDSTPGDSVTFTFTGDSIALYRLVDSNGGQATVTVDGKPMGVVDFFFPQQQTGTNAQRWQVPAVLDHLGAGQHTLVLTVSGNHDTASTTYTSNGNNVYIDSFAVPAPFTASADQQTALTRVNFYRNQAGLPPAALDIAVDLSAQAHASYNSTNPTNFANSAHQETIGAQGFVGVDFWNRMSYFGYNPANTAFEDAAQTAAASSVDEWMNSVYHRVPIMTYLDTDIGFGLSQLNGNLNTVMDFGNQSGVAPTSRLVTTYPANKQVNVPTIWNGEGPCPVPNCTSGTQGSPISVHIAQPAGTGTGTSTPPTSFQLTDPSGNPVPSTLVYAGNDPNNLLDNNTFALVPNAALSPGTTYTASIAGTDSQGNAFGPVTWSFTTIPNAAITYSTAFDITTTSAWIQVTTAGPSSSITSYLLVYGTTASYGMQGGNPAPNDGGPDSVGAELTRLTPNTTYHYQITTTDNQGNTWTTPDATFVTASVAH